MPRSFTLSRDFPRCSPFLFRNDRNLPCSKGEGGGGGGAKYVNGAKLIKGFNPDVRNSDRAGLRSKKRK